MRNQPQILSIIEPARDVAGCFESSNPATTVSGVGGDLHQLFTNRLFCLPDAYRDKNPGSVDGLTEEVSLRHSIWWAH